MFNYVFNTQKPDKIAPIVEAAIRKEAGLPTPLTYQVLNAEGAGVSVGSLLFDALTPFETTLYYLVFPLPLQRPGELRVEINRQGIGAHIRILTYSALLAKAVGGEVNLEPPRIFGNSRFVGDPQTITRLNSNSQLLKRANKIARTESTLGEFKYKIARYMKVSSRAQGSLLVLNTLPRKARFAFNAHLEVKEFFDLASQVEALL